MSVKVTFAGISGSITVEPANGSTVRQVLDEAAKALGLETVAINRLAAVVDSQPAGLDDRLASEAKLVTAAPRVRNGDA